MVKHYESMCFEHNFCIRFGKFLIFSFHCYRNDLDGHTIYFRFLEFEKWTH